MYVRVRPMRAPELADTVRLWCRSKAEAYSWMAIEKTYTFEDNRRYFRDEVVARHAVWLAEVDGEAVGLMALDDSGLIDQLFVDPEWQRRRIGSVLLEHARGLCPAGLRLFTFQENQRARRFYEKHGFAAVRFGRSPPPEDEPDVEYVWVPESEADPTG
jgi:GNAT superfamily N-acetyltransferase